jgi:hypothetical protein
MEIQALEDEINAALARIATLEPLEAYYISLLQIPSDTSDRKSSFDATVGKQDERHQLYAIHPMIHDLAILHNDLSLSFQRHESNMKRNFNFPAIHPILMRSNQIRHEIDEYLAQDDAVKEVNMVHIDNNKKMLAKVCKFLG